MRRPNWVSRLWQEIRTSEHTPFVLGKHDCCLFAAHCVDAMTDSEWAASLCYSDRRGALQFLKREGGLEAAVTKRLGEPTPGHIAERGSICLVDVERDGIGDGRGLGVCIGSTIAVACVDGLEFYPLARAIKHWAVR